MSKAAKQLLADVNLHIDDKRASMQFIKGMGYSFSKNKVLVKLDHEEGEGQDSFVVFELIDEEKPERVVPFSFLYDREREDGVVLPHPYSRYKSLGRKKRATQG